MMTPVRDRSSHHAIDDSGFTLTELMIVVALLSIILGAAYGLFYTANNISDATEAKLTATDDTWRAMDRMTRELRQAVEISQDQGVFLDGQPRTCSFYSDVDHDSVPELVTYRIVGKILYRSVGEPSLPVPPYAPFAPPSTETVVAKSIDGGWTGNAFTFYDSSDPPVEVHGNGRLADISAASLRLVNGATVNQRTSFVDLSTWVKIRSIHNSID